MLIYFLLHKIVNKHLISLMFNIYHYCHFISISKIAINDCIFCNQYHESFKVIVIEQVKIT